MSEPVGEIDQITDNDDETTSVFFQPVRKVNVGDKLYDESALREARIEGMRMARDACSLVFDESAIQRLIDKERK